jgi:glycosyltransferase involved in cell wall biosynthesis
MRILIVSQYFWPESFRINDLCLALKERGHDVTVLTGKPNYPKGTFSNGYGFFSKRIELWNGIKIYRSPLVPRGKGKGIQLFLNYFSFAFFASIRMLFINQKFARIFVYEPSPITVGLPGIVAKYKSKAPMYFWVQDLWPESISAAGGINNKFILGIFNWLTKLIYKNSEKVLVQSKAFIPYILNQNIDKSKLIYYPNSTESYYRVTLPTLEKLNLLPKGKLLMFAGNIGESQSFDTLLNAAVLLKKDFIDLHWIILGEGRMMNYVQSKIVELELESNFHLLGAFPSEDMPNFFTCADALIVSLKKNPIFSHTIPSKIQSYLACGKPILTSLDGEGSRVVEEANAGFISPSEDPIAFANIIKKFFDLTIDEQTVLGYNARKYFEIEFERELLVDKLEEILES